MRNKMRCNGYAASMVFDAKDKLIVGRVLEIDDIISFHGESLSKGNSRGSGKSSALTPPECQPSSPQGQRHSADVRC